MYTLISTLVAIVTLRFFHALLVPIKKIAPGFPRLWYATVVTSVVLLGLYLFGKPIDPTVLAVLLGGSILTYAYHMEAHGKRASVLVALGGIAMMYSILNERWLALGITVAIIALFWFLLRPKKQTTIIQSNPSPQNPFQPKGNF